ncbi:Cyclic AMP-dependent transcription factor ATF-2 [Lamellibrachia satsuma]|nr:Cyclic AMP-dependent transcription factor ATF-2 [Lamellibrachia satsuma]
MGDDDKPFACPEVGCRMRFTNEDHLMVHRMKHEMSLPLTPGLKPGQLLTFADQTPTPTRFLRNCEEIGLFNELKSNPFEEAFKKASEFIEPDGKSTEQPGQTSAVADTTVVCDNLNTPTPLLAPRNPPASPALAATTTQLLAAPSASFVPLPGPNKEVGSTVTPTSPVTIDQNAEVTVDSPVLCSSELPVVPPHDSNSLPQKTVISAVSAAPTTAAITTNVTAITTALSLSRAAVTTKAPSSVGVAGTSAVPRVLATGVPQYMLQVMVQMPSGDMVPVQIPAAPAPLAQSNLPAAVVSITTSVAPSTTVASAPLTTVATTAAAPLSTKQKKKQRKNDAKTEYSLIGTQQQLVKCTNTSINIGNSVIQATDCVAVPRNEDDVCQGLVVGPEVTQEPDS